MPLTFADIFIIQPESPLDLLVWVPDRAGLLKAVDSFLDVMVAKLVQQRHKVPTRCSPIQGVECIAEGYGETPPKSKSENSPHGIWIPNVEVPAWLTVMLESWLERPGEYFHLAKGGISGPK